MRKMGEKKKWAKNGHPEKLPIFSKVKKWATAKKKKWAQNGNLAKKVKKSSLRKKSFWNTLVLQGKNVVSNFSTERMSQKKKNGQKMGTRPFSKNGRSQKKNR